MFKAATRGVFNWTATYRTDSTVVAPYERWQVRNSSAFGRGCVNASWPLISSAVLQRERAPEPVDARRQRGGQQDEGRRLVRLQLRRQERPARLRQGAAKIHSGLITHRFYRMIIMVLTRLSGLGFGSSHRFWFGCYLPPNLDDRVS